MTKRPKHRGPDGDVPRVSDFQTPSDSSSVNQMTISEMLVRYVVKPLASLRFTVVLLALLIILIFTGTLSQTRFGIWQLVHDHFRVWIAWVDFQAFCQKIFFTDSLTLPGRFPLPGGKLIGTLMAINLLAAHGFRFKVRASGSQLFAGLITIAAGCGITWLVISTGSRDAAPTDAPLESWNTLSIGIKGLLGAVLFASGFAWFTFDRTRKAERLTLLISAVLSALLLAVIFYRGDSLVLSESSLRIVWYLAQGSLAAIVLLGGCWLVFGKQAGVVVIHAGIALLMANELIVDSLHTESIIRVHEGDSANFVEDSREIELAIVQPDFSAEESQVTAIPESALRESANNDGSLIKLENLPFDIRVLNYFTNSKQEIATAKKNNPADHGYGTREICSYADPVPAVANDRDNVPAAYVQLVRRKDGRPMGTYLAAWHFSEFGLATEDPRSGRRGIPLPPQPVSVGEKDYELDLRFKRTYTPYTIKLLDVRKDDYLGTSTAQNYSSEFELVDPSRNTDRIVDIRMNNPLRYAGATFYQQGYAFDPFARKEKTTLQVVANTGWMIPYVACMIVGFGLMYHFGKVLFRFLDRSAKSAPVLVGAISRSSDEPETTSASAKAPAPKVIQATLAEKEDSAAMNAAVRWVPIVLSLLIVVWLARLAMSPKIEEGEPQVLDFGKLPVVYEGRVKPFDSMARSTLRFFSGRESYRDVTGIEFYEKEDKGDYDHLVFKDDSGKEKPVWKAGVRRDAIYWLLDVVSHAEDVDRQPVFRIDHPDVLKLLDLDRRKGYLYSLDDFRASLGLLQEQAKDANAVDRMERDSYQNQVLSLYAKLNTYSSIQTAFTPAPGMVLTESNGSFEVVAEVPHGAREQILKLATFGEFNSKMESRQMPLCVPVAGGESEARGEDDRDSDSSADHGWNSLAVATSGDYVRALAKKYDAQSVDDLSKKLATVAAGEALKDNPSEKALAGAIQLFSRHIRAAATDALAGTKMDEPSKSADRLWWSIIGSYGTLRSPSGIDQQTATKEIARFNDSLSSYQNLLADEEPADYDKAKVNFEVFYNRFAPAFYPIWIYLLGALLAVFGWLGWSRMFNRAAFCVILIALAVQTFAFIARIYLSGRPPITNIYSAVLFTGWGCAVLGVFLDRLFRVKVGMIIAGVGGFVTLLIAFNLAKGGDTIKVLQAVLDTQFWLATHVTIITMGYAATFFAGFLGIYYVVRGFLTGSVVGETRKELSRMIYGTICFALVLSFVGTVLGGLWGDNSWGRFWGWDPKENGALIIVLWNALVLHARWGGVAGPRGVAVLAIFGNIVTTWSLFAVNELGVGLHSYGFTEGTRVYMMLFFLANLAIIALGSLPKTLWASYQETKPSPSRA